MRKTINLRKGLNLNLRGGVESEDVTMVTPSLVAVIPDDFPGFSPKLDVAEGDIVEAGTPLMHDKNCDSVKLVSPVAGKVSAVVRGARRKIERVVIAPEGNGSLVHDTANATSAETVKTLLMESGLWAMMRRRPYDIIPQAADKPRDIFVTAMDTTPLAWDPETLAAGKTAELAAGVKALKLLTSGNIYIGIKNGSQMPDIAGAEMVEFNALHPAGNAGIQAANISPVNKGEVIWTLDIITLARIGALMLTGKADFETTVAVTGSEVKTPRLIKTVDGADMAQLTEGNIVNDGRNHRIISGNVLTGIPVGNDGFLRFPYRQITVIPEGDDADEFMGWASLSPSKMSTNRSFLGHFLNRAFSPDARLQGGRRGMIMSGEYDKVFPMDILPEYLIKAIMSRDIDQMEALGIYEVAPEDFALCEYVDPSKLELQRIVREGLDYLRSEI